MSQPSYFTKYPTFHMERDDDGILLLRLKARDGDAAVKYSPQHHTDWSQAFVDVAADPDTKAVIITGTGDAFVDDYAWDRPADTPAKWDQLQFEGKHLLRRLLDIEVPVIGAVNGPATVHAELAVMSDIVIASPHATFQDRPHIPSGAVPGDGVAVVWQELLGMNRGRYFLLTGQVLSAEEALELGVVNEIVPHEQLLERAYELARPIAKLPPLVARYTRVVFTQRYKRRIDEHMAFGLAHEGLASLENYRLRALGGS